MISLSIYLLKDYLTIPLCNLIRINSICHCSETDPSCTAGLSPERLYLSLILGSIGICILILKEIDVFKGRDDYRSES